MPKKTTRARAAPPAVGQKRFLGWLRAVVAAVVATVKVEVVVAEAGFRLHVGASVAPDGLAVTAQVRLTVPVNEPDGVMVIVEVLPVVAPGETVIAPLFINVKPETTAAV